MESFSRAAAGKSDLLTLDSFGGTSLWIRTGVVGDGLKYEGVELIFGVVKELGICLRSVCPFPDKFNRTSNVLGAFDLMK